MSEWFFKFGVPARLHSDQGRNLESLLIQQLCGLSGIVKTRTTPYHPAGNGQCERFNRTLITCCAPCRHLGRETGTRACLKCCIVTTPLLLLLLLSTGETPFFLMFGQEPRLPVDFLLGRVESPVGGTVHEWVQEHQARLQVALEGARERLQHAADRRKRHHDKQVKARPLREGQVVFLRDFTARGPHKTQDRWSSVRYQVLVAPKEGGSVYTIAPVDDPTRTKRVHRTMLKAVVGMDSPGDTSSPPLSSEGPPSEDSCSFDYDLVAFGPQPSAGSPDPLPTGSIALTQSLPQAPALPASVPPEGNMPVTSSAGVLLPLAPPGGASISHIGSPASHAGPSHEAPRRTARSTAGHHTNVHRLPRPVEVRAVAPPAVSNAVQVIFRPWS